MPELAVQRRAVEVVLGVVGVLGDEPAVLLDRRRDALDAREELRAVVAQDRAVQRVLAGIELALDALQAGVDEPQRLVQVAEVHLDQREAVLVERQAERAPALVVEQARDRDRDVDLGLRLGVVAALGS